MNGRKRLLELNAGPIRRRIPFIEPGQCIPRILHQTYQTRELTGELASRVSALKQNSCGWDCRLYDDHDVRRFILASYPRGVLSLYERVDPAYGAARADLFRYLVIYAVGGVYLDIKSGASRPLDDIVHPDDRYLLSKWRNAPGEIHEGFGLHPALSESAGGEFQQWFLAAAPGHPFLKAVIERVLTNIDDYRPWRDGVGKKAVLAVTGPIAYTLAIQPLLALHQHRLESHEEAAGFTYSGMASASHEGLFPVHYSRVQKPVVIQPADRRLAFLFYRARRRVLRAIRECAAVTKPACPAAPSAGPRW